MPLERAAHGAYQIAVSNMTRAIQAVSTERGRDARDFELVAFGGNGPLFAAAWREALGMHRVLVPPSAGLFSAFGLLYADVEHHYGRTLRRLLRQCDLGELEQAWAALARQAAEQLAAEGFAGPRAGIAAARSAALPGTDVRAHGPSSRKVRWIKGWSAIWRKHSAASTRRPMVIGLGRMNRSSWSRSKLSARASAPAPVCPSA